MVLFVGKDIYHNCIRHLPQQTALPSLPISTINIGEWGERFVLVNGGCSSGKWLPRSWAVEVKIIETSSFANCGDDRYSIGAVLEFQF